MRLFRVSETGFDTRDRVPLGAPVLVAPFFVAGGFTALLPVASVTVPQALTGLALLAAGGLSVLVAYPRRLRVSYDFTTKTLRQNGAVRTLTHPLSLRLSGEGRKEGLPSLYRVELVDDAGEALTVLAAPDPARVIEQLQTLRRHWAVPLQVGWGLPPDFSESDPTTWPDGAAPSPNRPSSPLEVRVPHGARARLVSWTIVAAILFVGADLAALYWLNSSPEAPSLPLSRALPIATLLAMGTALFGFVSSYTRVRLSDVGRIERWSFGRVRSSIALSREQIRAAYYVSPDKDSEPQHLLLLTDSVPTSIPCGTWRARRATFEWLWGRGPNRAG